MTDNVDFNYDAVAHSKAALDLAQPSTELEPMILSSPMFALNPGSTEPPVDGLPYATNAPLNSIWLNKSPTDILADVTAALKAVDVELTYGQQPAPPGSRWDFDRLIVHEGTLLYGMLMRHFARQRCEWMQWYRRKHRRNR